MVRVSPDPFRREPLVSSLWESARVRIVEPARGRALVMGIVNVTPDSFSDGGRHNRVDDAVAHAWRLLDEGADILDVGGESSRPGAAPVPLDEELRRVLPVIERLAARTSTPLSIDTTKAEVARRALDAGAVVINDVSALRDDPAMLDVARDSGAAVILMHMQGTPLTMQDDPRYDDVVADVETFLRARIAATVAAGVPISRIAVDPGIGFGKKSAHNLSLLRRFERFAQLGCASVVGVSRKGVLAKIAPRPLDERAASSVAAALAAIARGADVARVHDVAATADAVRVWAAVGFDLSQTL